MTPYLIFIAIVVAAVIAGELISRSRKEPGGRSGLDPSDVPSQDAPLGDRDDRRGS